MVSGPATNLAINGNNPKKNNSNGKRHSMGIQSRSPHLQNGFSPNVNNGSGYRPWPPIYPNESHRRRSTSGYYLTPPDYNTTSYGEERFNGKPSSGKNLQKYFAATEKEKYRDNHQYGNKKNNNNTNQFHYLSSRSYDSQSKSPRGGQSPTEYIHRKLSSAGFPDRYSMFDHKQSPINGAATKSNERVRNIRSPVNSASANLTKTAKSTSSCACCKSKSMEDLRTNVIIDTDPYNYNMQKNNERYINKKLTRYNKSKNGRSIDNLIDIDSTASTNYGQRKYQV